MKTLVMMILFFVSSCSYSISLVHTEGTASDIIDETSTPTTTLSPNIQIPKGLSL